MRQVLVTGGSGFIGQHLVTTLLAHDRRVRVLDLRPPRCATTAVQYVRGSILDSKLLETTLDDVEEVYHLAGLPGMWARHRNDFHLINAQGTAIVIAAARKRAISRFLHCSTHSFSAFAYGICAWRRRRRHVRANARGLHALENAGRTAGFAGCGVRLSRGHC